MGLISEIFYGIGAALRSLYEIGKRLIKRIWRAILSFVAEIRDWFRSLELNPQTHDPFIVRSNRLNELIQNAPRIPCGIFEGVYNEQTGTIEHAREIEAGELDERTRAMLDNATDDNPIVVLS